MKTLVATLSCALVAAACADRPLRYPAYGATSTTAAPSENYGNASSATIYSSNQRPRNASAPVQASPPQPSTATEETAAEETAAAQRRVAEQSSASETKISADILKGLMASHSLSFGAKNAQIITAGTKVTLRGTVASEAEKAEIEGVAKATAGVSEVDNQLEVKKSGQDKKSGREK